jgi:hypothetical protein
MRLNGDSTKIHLQTERTWNNLGFKIADAIDRAMCAADGLAALQRAADLVTLIDAGEAGAVELRVIRGDVRIAIVDSFDPAHVRAFEGCGDAVIAEAAAWIRQRGCA